MPHADRLSALAEVHRVYEGDVLVRDPSRFFPAPRPSPFTFRPVRSGVWEASWPSAFEPFLPAVSDRYLARVENRTARARFYTASSSDQRELRPDEASARPVVIAIHGYMAGQWLLEENQWPVDWMVRRGLDVVLPVLPFHAGRAGTRRGPPNFPSSDPRVTNEGFRQAVTDIRSIVRVLRERGASHVGVVGMSLGGYTSALLATVTDEIDFVIPMIPLASIADFAREQGQLGSGDQVGEQHAALEQANWIVSPLARPLRIPKARALVVAAEHDRVTPGNHAKRLASHFGCDLMTFAGGHLLQVGRSDAFRALGSLLEREGIIRVPNRRSA